MVSLRPSSALRVNHSVPRTAGDPSIRGLHGNALDQHSCQIILLRRPSGEANDRLIKLGDDDFWIAITEPSKDFGKTIGSEWLLLGFSHSKKPSVMRSTISPRSIASLVGTAPYSKRQNLRMHVSQRLVSGRVNEKRTMTGGEQLHLVATFSEHRRDKGRKAFGRQVFRKRLVDISKDRGQIIAFIKAGTRIGTAHRCEYCRANAVSGYIGQEHCPPAVGQSLPIVKIPASIIRRLAPACHRKPRICGRSFGKSDC